jgi:prepilin-type N-terminal cleavage/methylation domain-containing protein
MDVRGFTTERRGQSRSSEVRIQLGFTVIELLITASIMSILAVATAYVMAGAQESASIAKTRSLIARLHALVMQKYESYRYRRLPVAMPAGLSPQAAAKVRCDVIRQLMRMEMPDRWTDVTDNPTPLTTATGAVVRIVRPTCSLAYAAFYNSVSTAKTSKTAFLKHGSDYQGAKCLYLLISMGLEDTDVMENFSEGDIADFDQTGCKVFLDAWGRPIRFLRWAPGFVSPLQPAKPGTNGIPATARDLRMPDQTDPTGVYGVPQNPTTTVPGKADTFALYPLIFSDGPDGRYDIVSDGGNVNSGNFRYSQTKPPNNPFAGYGTYADNSMFPDGPFGTPAAFPASDRPRTLGHSDNVHNHTIGAR